MAVARPGRFRSLRSLHPSQRLPRHRYAITCIRRVPPSNASEGGHAFPGATTFCWLLSTHFLARRPLHCTRSKNRWGTLCTKSLLEGIRGHIRCARSPRYNSTLRTFSTNLAFVLMIRNGIQPLVDTPLGGSWNAISCAKKAGFCSRKVK